MTSLSAHQRTILDEAVDALARVDGIEAIVLGGSHARGRARPDSDLDLGLYYADAHPPDLAGIRRYCDAASTGGPATVTALWEWGPFVNGGAWLAVGDQPVDLLYRSLDQQVQVIEAAERGEYELHFAQQPPFGFFGPTLLGEIQIARVLHDPGDRLGALKARVARYPEALRERVVDDFLWSAAFALAAFGAKAAKRGDAWLTASVLARVAHAMTLALFALNRTHLLNDKTALDEITGFETRPEGFAERVREILGAVGGDAETQTASVARMQAVFDEAAALADGLYTPRFTLRDG